MKSAEDLAVFGKNLVVDGLDLIDTMNQKYLELVRAISTDTSTLVMEAQDEMMNVSITSKKFIIFGLLIMDAPLVVPLEEEFSPFTHNATTVF